MTYHSYIPTIDPDEAVRIALHRPIVEQETIKPIGQAFMRYAQDKNFGFRSFILTMAQVFYSAGMTEGVRSERNRKRNANCIIVTSEPAIDERTFVSVICEDGDAAKDTMALVSRRFSPPELFIRGNELLMPVPEHGGMGFSLNTFRSVVAPCRVSMFHYERDDCGNLCRYWY